VNRIMRMIAHMGRPPNDPVITPQKLAEVGEALFGLQWQSDLARAIGRSLRSMVQLAAGERAVTREIAEELAKVCQDRGRAALELARELRKVSK
jgi:plasmid maintenance system antidote protein VapI